VFQGGLLIVDKFANNRSGIADHGKSCHYQGPVRVVTSLAVAAQYGTVQHSTVQYGSWLKMALVMAQGYFMASLGALGSWHCRQCRRGSKGMDSLAAAAQYRKWPTRTQLGAKESLGLKTTTCCCNLVSVFSTNHAHSRTHSNSSNDGTRHR
jgi:hypothetical protein